MKRAIILLVILLAVAAAAFLLWGGGERAPEPVALSPRVLSPSAVLALRPFDRGPIREGCGDFRLLVEVETSAPSAAARVAGPAHAVDVVWNYRGPGLAVALKEEGARVFNDDNREYFGIDGNRAGTRAKGSHILLVSGVRRGELLAVELGQELWSPAIETTWRFYNFPARGGKKGRTLLLEKTLRGKDTAVARLDVCAAEPLEAPPSQEPAEPKVVAFYYPWWSTTKKAAPPLRCGGDEYGWVRENEEGERVFITSHTPLFREGDRVLYRETACWQEEKDDRGRQGWAYDVFEPRFLAEQMRVAAAAGIDAFAVSVHGDNGVEMDFLREWALPTAARNGFTVAALYERPEEAEYEGWRGGDAQDRAWVGQELRRVVEILGASEASMRWAADDPRVVVFVDPMLIARFPDRESWAALRAEIDEAGIPYALISGPGSFPYIAATGAFEGLYNDLEVVETFEAPLGLLPYALRDERRLAYKGARAFARERGMRLALPAVTGWESAFADPANPDDTQLLRDYGGALGEYYRVRWEDALEQEPDWIVLTSWNEWAEGTELEPSDTYPPSDYNFLYATRAYTRCFKEGVCGEIGER